MNRRHRASLTRCQTISGGANMERTNQLKEYVNNQRG